MKLGLPTGAEAEKAASAGAQGDVPTSATPPGVCTPPEPAGWASQLTVPEMDCIIPDIGL